MRKYADRRNQCSNGQGDQESGSNLSKIERIKL